MTSTSLSLRCIARRAETHDVASWQFVPLAGDLPPCWPASASPCTR